MLVRMLANQTPQFWEAIKFACREAEVVKGEDYQVFFTNLLHALLSDKAQCFIQINENRTITGLFITKVLGDKITGDKQFCLQVAHSWIPLEETAVRGMLSFLCDHARHEGCACVTFESNSRRALTLAGKLGFTERSKTFEYRL